MVSETRDRFGHDHHKDSRFLRPHLAKKNTIFCRYILQCVVLKPWSSAESHQRPGKSSSVHRLSTRHVWIKLLQLPARNQGHDKGARFVWARIPLFGQQHNYYLQQ